MRPIARRHRWSAAVVAVAAAVAVSGCTGDDETSPTTLVQLPETTPPAVGPTTSVAAPDLTTAYFGAIADGRPAPETVAVPGSDADDYARFRSVAARLLDGAPSGSVAGVSTVPSGVDVCDPDCTNYSLVATDPSTGRIETFAIDGLPLAGRVVGDGLRADDDGVVASVDSAYRNREGDVLVVVEVRNTTDVTVELFGFSSVYVPSGTATSREATGWWGPESFDAGIGGSMLLVFGTDATTGDDTASPLGSGRVSLSGLRSDGVAVTLDLTVPRAGG